jgi:hypothetical protein
LIPDQKQTELEKYRAILLATIDYLISKHAGSFVVDNEDFIGDSYQQQKLQTEKYFNQRRLDRLKQQFLRLTKGLQNQPDLTFGNYIKEKTGYDMDIFEDVRKRVDAIVEQNKINNEKELSDVNSMLHFYKQSQGNDQMMHKLKALFMDYANQKAALDKSVFPKKRKNEYTKIISKVEENGVEKTTFTAITGAKPKHWEVEEVLSPDGKRRLHVTQWSDGKHASTCVSVIFPTASGAVYGVNGICPDVKAFWKNNSTIVIKTNKDYLANIQCKEVRSFDDVIIIEYIEQ